MGRKTPFQLEPFMLLSCKTNDRDILAGNYIVAGLNAGEFSVQGFLGECDSVRVHGFAGLPEERLNCGRAHAAADESSCVSCGCDHAPP